MIDGLFTSINIFKANFFEELATLDSSGSKNHFETSLGAFSLRAPNNNNCFPLLTSEFACFCAREI
jgi:hypothetical protein